MEQLTNDKMIEFGYEFQVSMSNVIYYDITSILRVYSSPNNKWFLHFIAQVDWTPMLCEINSLQHFKDLVFNLTGKQL